MKASVVNSKNNLAKTNNSIIRCILPLFFNKCQKVNRKHKRNYSSEVSSESKLKLLDESESTERGMVEEEARVAAWTLE